MSSPLLFTLTRRFWLWPVSLLVLLGVVLAFNPTEALTAAVQLSHGEDECFWSAPWSMQSDAEEAFRDVLTGPAVGDAPGSQVRPGLAVCCFQVDILSLPAAVLRSVAWAGPGGVAVQAVLSSVIVVRAGPLRSA